MTIVTLRNQPKPGLALGCLNLVVAYMHGMHRDKSARSNHPVHLTQESIPILYGIYHIDKKDHIYGTTGQVRVKVLRVDDLNVIQVRLLPLSGYSPQTIHVPVQRIHAAVRGKMSITG